MFSKYLFSLPNDCPSDANRLRDGHKNFMEIEQKLEQEDLLSSEIRNTRLSYYNVTTRLVNLVGLCWFYKNLMEKIC